MLYIHAITLCPGTEEHPQFCDGNEPEVQCVSRDESAVDHADSSSRGRIHLTIRRNTYHSVDGCIVLHKTRQDQTKSESIGVAGVEGRWECRMAHAAGLGGQAVDPGLPDCCFCLDHIVIALDVVHREEFPCREGPHIAGWSLRLAGTGYRMKRACAARAQALVLMFIGYRSCLPSVLRPLAR